MDINLRAFRVVQEATNGNTSPPPNPKKLAARKGGLIGGPSRARSIGAKRRSEIAKRASTVRWNKQKAMKEKGENGNSPS
jgi:hypothetical protein